MRQLLDRIAAPRAQAQHDRRHALEHPQTAEHRLSHRLTPQARIENQPGLSAVLLAHMMTEERAVNLLVAETPTLGIDDDTAPPRERRIDEAPRRHAFQMRRGAANG